ncbi:hypothetical protein F8568_003930 [Actinomadura sp. LD22]|uniref:Uncharacterized protein n=1 Tax=Actinomadura physcomitrii TaxID=2650748 RepID=A0A6I4M386_9ACTN|nr:hypothetical protein [Actinomadura physcomitrii]MVZ99539.1 hypothetical protein [Actinomadura physcomitrii]
MTSTPHRYETDGSGTRAPSALDELRAAYREQLNQLAAERDAARRQARRAKAQADVARADLASLKSRVQELLAAAARHLPDLPAVEAADRPAEIGAASAAPRALPAPATAESRPAEPVAAEPARAVSAESAGAEVERAADSASTVRRADAADAGARPVERKPGETVRHQNRRESRKARRRRVRTG